MSRIHERLQSLHKQAADAWFLKVSTGQKYGPVSLATLRQWAAEGRIAADSLVSRDNRSWFPAESLPDLEMNWIVTLADGSSYGPFNLQATRHLVSIGLIDVDAVVRNRHTDRRLTVKSVLEAKDISALEREQEGTQRAPKVLEMVETGDGSVGLSRMVTQLADEARGKVQELKEMARQWEEEKARRVQAETRCTELEKKLREQTLAMERAIEERKSELEEARRGLVAELENLKKRQAEMEAAATAREQSLLARIRELEEEATGGTELLAQAQEQLREQQAALRTERERTASEIARLSDKLKKSEEQCKALTAEADELRKQVAALESAANTGIERAAAREKELLERVSGLEKELEAARSENEKLRHELRLRDEARSAAEERAASIKTGLEEKIGQLEAALADARKEIGNLRDNLEREKGRTAEFEQAVLLTRRQAETEIGELRRVKEEVEGELSAVRQTLMNLQSALEKKNAEVESLRSEYEAEKEKSRAARAVTAVSEGEKGEGAWYLRTEDGTVCGPVTLEQLGEWAADCRVAPEHEVSRDGKTWVPAGTVPELRMEWKVTLADGTTYGPLHLFAVQDLIEEGVVAPDSEVTNAVTGKVIRADRLYVEEFALLEDQNRRLAARLEEMAGLLAAEQERVRKLEAERVAVIPITAGLPPRAVREYMRRRAAQAPS